MMDEKGEMIKKWREVFRKAGFDDYMIDFSDVEPEMIEHLGKAIEEYYKQRKLSERIKRILKIEE